MFLLSLANTSDATPLDSAVITSGDENHFHDNTFSPPQTVKQFGFSEALDSSSLAASKREEDMEGKD